MSRARQYHLSKKITQEQADKVLQELQALEHVERAEIRTDSGHLLVKTQEEYYPDVMGRAVNICRRVAGGADLSFAGFVHED